MKRNFSLHPATLLTIILSIFLLSCSKENTLFPQPPDESTLSADNSAAKVGNRGSVTGMISPLKTDYKITIFNRNFSSSDFYFSKNGGFRFDMIPADIYTITITYFRSGSGYPTTAVPIPAADGMFDYTINGIKVGAGKITDLGVITLP